jgi:hypothetical protein
MTEQLLRERFDRLMLGRGKAPHPQHEPAKSLEYETIWVEAFKLTEKHGKWSASRAAGVLGPRASEGAGAWILNRYQSRARNSRG